MAFLPKERSGSIACNETWDQSHVFETCRNVLIRNHFEIAETVEPEFIHATHDGHGKGTGAHIEGGNFKLRLFVEVSERPNRVAITSRYNLCFLTQVI